jgi:hypothetical protein
LLPSANTSFDSAFGEITASNFTGAASTEAAAVTQSAEETTSLRNTAIALFLLMPFSFR